MPEGPSLVILREEMRPFAGKRVVQVEGNAKIPLEQLKGQKLIQTLSWGKHLLLCFGDFYLRVHFLMFGSYRINERRHFAPRLHLAFRRGEVSFYSCSIKLLNGDPKEQYDWSTDVLADEWNKRKALAALRAIPGSLICDALLDQQIFSGVGNIIKNEVLYRVRVHPESKVGRIPIVKLREIVNEARLYSFDFLEWKKKYELRSHWLVYKQRMCYTCGSALVRTYSGKTDRLTFCCPFCQKKFS